MGMEKRWRKGQESESKARQERNSYLSKKTVTCLIDPFVRSCAEAKVPRVGTGLYLPCHPEQALGGGGNLARWRWEGARAAKKSVGSAFPVITCSLVGAGAP